jgi:flagellar hook-associated protein 1 FlgK
MFNVGSPVVYANTNNADTTQSISVTVNSVSNLSTSDYRLTYDGTNYTLIRLEDSATWTSPDFTTWTSGATTTTWPIDGITIGTGTWVPVAGDNFLIQPTRTGARDIGVLFSDPRMIAAAAPMRTAPTLANTGTGTISAGTVNTPPPPDANLQNTVTITFTSATTFDVVDAVNGTLATGVAYTAGSDITYNGWTMQISGTPATGDVFTVSANSNGVSDSRNAVLLGELQTKKMMIGGTATYQSTYSQMVSVVGNKASTVEVTAEAQQQLADQASTKSQELSGVNLDEEAANLLRYQQAYQASAKIISIAGVLFDTILSIKT